jgi:hypothetical protein
MAPENDPFDAEPREELPALSIGTYEVTVSRVELAETFYGEKLFIEVTVDASKGADALPVGTRAKYKENMNPSKKALPYMVKRVKSFVYPALGRRPIPWEEIKGLLGDSSKFEGKKLRVSVTPQTDEEGEPKLKDDGSPWTEVVWSSL